MDTPMRVTNLLPELLDIILDGVHDRQDLLSLALTCSSFASIIVPDRLDYHTIVASPYHIRLWEQFAANRRLASFVHKLSLHDDPRQLRRWRIPPHLGDPSYQHAAGQYDAYHFTSALRNMRNAIRLNLRYVRTPHVRVAMPTLPDTLPIVFANLKSVEHVSTSTHLSPSDEVALRSPNHPIWSLSGMKSLNLDISGHEESLWPMYRAILLASPGLEDIRLPDFFTEDSMAKLCNLRFNTLKRFDRSYPWSMALNEYIVEFMRTHPTIEALHWPTITTADITPDSIPSLRRLSAPNASFFSRFIQRQPPKSIHLESLSNVSLDEEHIPLLDAIDPTTLRHLHVEAIDDYTTLRAISSRFTAINSLQLPRRGAWRSNARFTTRIAHAMLRPWYQDLQLLSLVEVLALFPRLESVRGVRCPPELDLDWPADDPRTQAGIEALKMSYPRLRRVNCWRLRG